MGAFQPTFPIMPRLIAQDELNEDVISLILDGEPFSTITTLSHICRETRRVCQKYVEARIVCQLEKVFGSKEAAFKILECLDNYSVVMAGTLVLSVLDPDAMKNKALSVTFYIPNGLYHEIQFILAKLGFTFCTPQDISEMEMLCISSYSILSKGKDALEKGSVSPIQLSSLCLCLSAAACA